LKEGLMMNKVTKSMGSVCKNLDSVMTSLRQTEITKVMDSFNKLSSDLNVITDYTSDEIDYSTNISSNADETNALMAQVADQYKLEIVNKLPKVETGAPIRSNEKIAQEVNQESLMEQFAKLKGIQQ